MDENFPPVDLSTRLMEIDEIGLFRIARARRVERNWAATAVCFVAGESTRK
ncbi:UNVERIFIED_CONTAM: hypothetical protein Sindi_2343300, partial [Sesamum indicum]